MRQRVQDQPRDFQAHLQLGIVLFKEDNFAEARTHLELAHQILPDYSAYPSPSAVLAQIYEKEGNHAARLEQLKIMLENQQHDYDAPLLLAREALSAGDAQQAQYYLDRAMAVTPYRIEAHQVSAQLARQIEDAPSAVREYEVLVKLDRNDPVEAHTNLAEAYLDNGQRDEARINILSALEIAPSYQRAQQVLLQAVEARQP
jgi:Tfp pilus assembly protein PilF